MPADTDELVRRFLPGDTLLRLPSKHAKRLLVLARVADRFEPGVRYSEKQVDEVLRALTDGGETDHVTLRRYLVDTSLLAREDGVYWRTGGWVAGT
ncbi:MAG: DUF2087 domain-containing protein [Nocardioidaceae bacterium]